MKKTFLILTALLCLNAFFAEAKPVKRNFSYAMQRASEAYDNDDYDECIKWVKQELEENPKNGYALSFLSTMYYAKGNYGEALNEVENAIKLTPKKDKNWMSGNYITRAVINLELADTLAAIKDFETSLKLESENEPALIKYAELLYEMHDYDYSDEQFSKLIKLNPGQPLGYLGKGRNESDRKNFDSAVEWFSKAIKLDPENSTGYSFRGEALLDLGKYAEGVDDIIKALDIDSDNKAFYHLTHLPSSEAQDMAKVKLKVMQTKQPSNNYWPFALASLASSRKEYADAIPFYEKAYSLDPHPLFLKRIAKCLLEISNYDKALEYTDRYLEMEPEDVSIFDIRAELFSNKGDIENALVERNKIIVAYPEGGFTYIERADLLMDLNKPAEAVEDYETAVALMPELTTLPYLHTKLGDAYRFSGKDAKARSSYQRVIELEKDSIASAREWTPFALSALGRNQEAIKLSKQIVENDTTDLSGNLYNLTCIYARTGDNENALSTLRKAIKEGYKNYGHLKTDYDLHPLRKLPEFIEMVDALEKKMTNDNDKEQETDADISFVEETVEVPFTKEGGVTKVQCSINNLPLHFVFDTGASDVTLSLVEANFMVKNNFINKSDIIGAARYVDANGDINEGTVINLRKVNFGGLELDNVRASVVRNQKAPLLLGQSVLSRLGKIEIDNTGKNIKITHRIRK